MQIFISWSGDSSKEIAKAIKNWLPKVLQATKPYFTPQDIDKGSKWLSDILLKLNECAVGIICLTPENIHKPWILFEAGALSNRSEIAIVCPLLFNITKANVSGPLGMFQATEFNKLDFKELLKTINSRLGESKVTDDVLNESFELFFPKLENEINNILDKDKSTKDIAPIERNEREILEEILELVRSQSYNKNNVSDNTIGAYESGLNASDRYKPNDYVLKYLEDAKRAYNGLPKIDE